MLFEHLKTLSPFKEDFDIRFTLGLNKTRILLYISNILYGEPFFEMIWAICKARVILL
jgi:hypothetical protein